MRHRIQMYWEGELTAGELEDFSDPVYGVVAMQNFLETHAKNIEITEVYNDMH